MDEEPKSYEFNEYVTSKLCEWSDPIARLEKKRIRRQIVNQHCREWMYDIVNLEPSEIALLARNVNEASELKRDHIRYIRKAVFDEYTYKVNPKYKRRKDFGSVKGSRMSSLKLAQESKLELKSDEKLAGHSKNDDSSESGGGEGLRREMNRLGIGFEKHLTLEKNETLGTVENEPSWFCRPWITENGLAQDCASLTANRELYIQLLVRSLVEEVLNSHLDAKVLETVRLLQGRMLFDAILPKATEMVNTLVENAKKHTSEPDHKWLEVLLNESPKNLTKEMVDEAFEVCSLNNLKQKICKKFLEVLLVPISDSIMKKYVMKDPSIVTTNFNRENIISYIKLELNEYKHFSTTFKTAEEVAEAVADEVTKITSFNLDIIKPQSELCDSEHDLQTKCEKRMVALERQAESQAKKLLHHLKTPEKARKDIDKKHSANEGYTSENNFCRCTKLSKQAGKNEPFKIPHFKVKSNYYFYNKFISDANKNLNSVTLYPKSTNNVKLVCDDHWNCVPVPLERELRDIPYRFSYAPPYVTKQIRETKAIKKSDRYIIHNILRNMKENKKFNRDAKLKNIIGENAAKGDSKASHSSVESYKEVRNDTITDRSAPAVENSVSLSDSGVTFLKSTTKKCSVLRAGLSISKSKSMSWNFGSYSSVNPYRVQPEARMRMPMQISKEVELIKPVDKAPNPPPYHKYALEGYNYDMVPITPCRFHSLKKIKDILKRFELAGEQAGLEYHLDTPKPPVNIDELLPIPRLVDAYGQWKKNDEDDTSLWTKALNDSRSKRMAKFRKLLGKDPIFGFLGNWERPIYKCPV